MNDVDWRQGPPLPDDAPMVLPELFARCVDRFGDATMLVDGDRTATWHQLERWSAALAATWIPRLHRGARLLVLLPNGLPHLLAVLTAWRLGVVAVPVSVHTPADALARFIKRLAPDLAVCDDPALRRLVGCCPVIDVDTLYVQAHGRELLDPVIVQPERPCLILPTSGSTGDARAVVLTHANLCSQQAAFAMLWPDAGPGDRLAGYLPWHHSFGANAERLWSLSRGMTLHVVPGDGRDPQRVAASVQAVRPTIFQSVPKLHRVVTEADALDRSCLRWVFTAGAPLGPREDLWYRDRGITVLEGYGATECGPAACITTPATPRLQGIVGPPIPGVAVGVRVGDGRVFVRGPGVMRGYFRDDDASAAALTDGVLDTGDVGAWTGDGLRLLGRADQAVKLANGRFAHPQRIEAALMASSVIRHAVVGEYDGTLVAVVDPADGIPDQDLGAAVAAVNAQAPVGWWRLRFVWRVTEPLSHANGGLTASHKVARADVLAALGAWIADRPLGLRFRRVTLSDVSRPAS